MNPTAQQYAKLNSGIVPPVYKPQTERLATLWYRGKPILQNVSFKAANGRKKKLLQTGAYVTKFLEVKSAK
jgi:hypothetical protein